MIFQPEIETMGREEMRALQLQRLQQTVRYVYERVPLYRERLDALKVRPEDIRSLDDVRRLPFTTKEDFRANYPYGLFAVPMKDIVRIHASSGTTGQPTVVGYTEQDIDMWATCVARLCAAGGATREDIAQISLPSSAPRSSRSPRAIPSARFSSWRTLARRSLSPRLPMRSTWPRSPSAWA